MFYDKIEKLEKENNTLKSDFSSMEIQNTKGKTLNIFENGHSYHEIKKEPLDCYDFSKKYSNSESSDKIFFINIYDK